MLAASPLAATKGSQWAPGRLARLFLITYHQGRRLRRNVHTTPSVSRYFRRAASTLPYLPRTFSLIWRAARGWTTAWAALLIVQGLLPIASVYLTRAVVNRAVAVFRTQGDPVALRAALIPAGLIAAILLLGEVLRGVLHWVRVGQADLVQDYISALIHRQSAAADLAFYETPNFYDHLHRARAEAAYRPVVLLEGFGTILQNVITLLGMGIVLVPFGLWLPIALVVSTLPAFWVVLSFAEKQHQWRQRSTSGERRAWYYDWVLTSGESAAELRLFGLGEHFQSAYQSVRKVLRDERLSLAREQSTAELGAGAAALAVTGASLLWMAWRAILGLISLGDLVLFYQAFQQGLQLMRSLLENAGQLYGNLLFLGNLYEFLKLQPIVVTPPSPRPTPAAVREGVRFEDVRFRYPGTNRLALEGLNLFIPSGKRIGIMGPNGAGKSTLVKLLCRFYDPDAGSITLDGIDLRELDIDELRSRISVLFQQPVRYDATASDNIALGDLSAAPTETVVEAAAQAAGADSAIRKLPRGYNNFLGKRFAEGAELSVGEWQRVALARAFVRRAPVIILDEPTSALDPWTEADWLARFRRLAAGHTALIITHRFTTAMLADEIHVMENGRITESGTHAELIASGGQYAKWWAAQKNP